MKICLIFAAYSCVLTNKLTNTDENITLAMVITLDVLTASLCEALYHSTTHKHKCT